MTSEFADAPVTVDRVALAVRDLAGTAAFYRDVVGLETVAEDGETAALGAGGKVLLDLRRDPHARVRSAREAGLFHTAFLLPTRADLARWARAAIERRTPLQGASDHVVSEAFYLADPEGNGIEIYADRPSDRWARTEGGEIAMRTDPLDLDGLLADAEGGWEGAPAGTTVGHVHLQVGALEPADAFYGGVLGLDLTARYPGASFFSSGGYHHHLAANVWNSRGTAERTPSTGLADVRLHVADPAALAAVAERAEAAGVATERSDGRLALRDPWNTALTLAARPA